ncbi:MAG: ATP synthase subunit I [Candidatus Acidiferrales bacterium]
MTRTPAVENEAFYRAAERRIEWLTLASGGTAAVVTCIRWGINPAVSLSLGALVSWVNFRWMKQGIAGLEMLSTAQADAPKPRVPRKVYAKFLGRYALLIVGSYAILRSTKFPAAAFLAGLFAIAAGVLVEMIYELGRGGRAGKAQ